MGAIGSCPVSVLFLMKQFHRQLVNDMLQEQTLKHDRVIWSIVWEFCFCIMVLPCLLAFQHGSQDGRAT